MVPSLEPESLSPSLWAVGGAGLAGCPARVCLAGLSVPPTLAHSKAGPPDNLTARLSHTPLILQPQLCCLVFPLISPLLQVCISRKPSWTGKESQHGAVPTWRQEHPRGLVEMQMLRVTFNQIPGVHTHVTA